jgi:outer membrane protein assembly factor BamB
MMRTRYVRVFVLLTVSVLSSGCSLFEKTKIPLKGKRVTLEQIVSLPLSSTPLSSSLLTSSCVPSHTWLQPGYTTSHNAGPFSLAPRLSMAWEVSGLGENNRVAVSPIVTSEGIFLLTSAGSVKALTQKGECVWETVLAESKSSFNKLGGGLACEGSAIYVTTPHSTLFALCAKTGKILWRVCLPAPSRNGPCVHQGKIAVLTLKNQVLFYEASSGKELWVHNALSEETSLLGGSVPSIAQDRVIAATSAGEVIALSLREGEVLWSQNGVPAKNSGEGQKLPHIQALPLVTSQDVLTLSYNGQLSCFDLYTGQPKWMREVGGTQTPVLNGRVLFFLCEDKTLIALDHGKGTMFWSTDLPSGRWMGPLYAGGLLYLLSTDGVLIGVDPLEKGRCIVRYDLKEPCLVPPLVGYGGIFVLSQKGTLFFLKGGDQGAPLSLKK